MKRHPTEETLLVSCSGDIYDEETYDFNKFIKRGNPKCWGIVLDNKKFMSVHRLVAQTFIPNPSNHSCVDHINMNRFDNRVENLRWVTKRQNGWNSFQRKSKHDKGGYKYKGVYFQHGRRPRAIIRNEDGTNTSLGSFDTCKQAARAWNNAAIEKHGDFANLNVLSDSESE